NVTGQEQERDKAEARACSPATASRSGRRRTTCADDGFRLAALDALRQLDACQGFGGEEDDAFAFLAEVPILAEVAPAVQVDLLADVRSRHRVPRDQGENSSAIGLPSRTIGTGRPLKS